MGLRGRGWWMNGGLVGVGQEGGMVRKGIFFLASLLIGVEACNTVREGVCSAWVGGTKGLRRSLIGKGQYQRDDPVTLSLAVGTRHFTYRLFFIARC